MRKKLTALAFFVLAFPALASSAANSSDKIVSCEANFFDGSKWTMLGKNESDRGSSNVDFSYGDVSFHATANLDQDLMYFGSIYHSSKKIGTAIQLAKNKQIHLYLFDDITQYTMTCKIR